MASCERISEAYLLPVLEELLQSFRFVIRGFHSDNGSEFINGPVVRLLKKLLPQEQTKSRSRHCNDKAQADSKNGAIVRKHLGYSHIPQRFAALVNAFDREYLNPYVNFHRLNSSGNTGNAQARITRGGSLLVTFLHPSKKSDRLRGRPR